MTIASTADRWVRLGAGLAALAVLAGAFGAHGLRHLLDDRALATFDTGARYHLLHALGVILAAREARSWLPALLLTVGIVLFSGSLYLLALTGQRWLGAVTPLGGLAFVAGWLVLALERRP